ncbi:hypothetical protein C8J57DRAFT_1276926 [Mycena rebaudengoi]|nr:hypothetical protein C8J57DRAFT_1276926 [Mycena rebaudengoi]
MYLDQRPEVIPHIHALWVVTAASRRTSRLRASIINTCTSIRSLACDTDVLLESICAGQVFAHTRLIDLTLADGLSQFNLTSSASGTRLVHQIHHLQLEIRWQLMALPHFENLTHMSLRLSSYCIRQLTADVFVDMVKSHRLEQVVILAYLWRAGDRADVAKVIGAVDDPRLSVIYHRRHWEASSLWCGRVRDRDRLWVQAKKQKCAQEQKARLDISVWPRHKLLLTEAYRAFPFEELPVELALEILLLAASHSKGTYRSVLLTSLRILNLACIETLSAVPVILTTEFQMTAFKAYLDEHPEAIPHIRALWIIGHDNTYSCTHQIAISIVHTCTSIRSLGCRDGILWESVYAARPLRHTQCVDLTVVGYVNPDYSALNRVLNEFPSSAAFLNQLQHLHLIEPDQWDSIFWLPLKILPELKNLTHLSIATRTDILIRTPQWPLDLEALRTQVVKAPRLQQVVLTTRLHGEELEKICKEARRIDACFVVVHRPRRWKESRVWQQSLQDRQKFWTRAAVEEDKTVTTGDLVARR